MRLNYTSALFPRPSLEILLLCDHQLYETCLRLLSSIVWQQSSCGARTANEMLYIRHSVTYGQLGNFWDQNKRPKSSACSGGPYTAIIAKSVEKWHQEHWNALTSAKTCQIAHKRVSEPRNALKHAKECQNAPNWSKKRRNAWMSAKMPKRA